LAKIFFGDDDKAVRYYTGLPLYIFCVDFGKASSEGYTAYDGSVQSIDELLELPEGTDCNIGILDFIKLESE